MDSSDKQNPWRFKLQDQISITSLKIHRDKTQMNRDFTPLAWVGTAGLVAILNTLSCWSSAKATPSLSCYSGSLNQKLSRPSFLSHTARNRIVRDEEEGFRVLPLYEEAAKDKPASAPTVFFSSISSRSISWWSIGQRACLGIIAVEKKGSAWPKLPLDKIIRKLRAPTMCRRPIKSTWDTAVN